MDAFSFCRFLLLSFLVIYCLVSLSPFSSRCHQEQCALGLYNRTVVSLWYLAVTWGINDDDDYTDETMNLSLMVVLEFA